MRAALGPSPLVVLRLRSRTFRRLPLIAQIPSVTKGLVGFRRTFDGFPHHSIGEQAIAPDLRIDELVGLMPDMRMF